MSCNSFGTHHDRFFDLYARTARAVKSAFPHLKVGGPGFALTAFVQPQGREMVTAFLDYQRRVRAPLDFLSWHIYSNDRREYAEAARFYHSMLDRHGFTAAESHITEYHTDEKRRPRGLTPLALRAEAPRAAVLSAAWITLQRENIAAAFVCLGADSSTDKPDFYELLLSDQTPKLTALALSLWARLAECQQRCEVLVRGQTNPLYVLAARNTEGQSRLLIANPPDRAVRWNIRFAETANP
ncbi:MAG: GH39 family glycosyl hydrolase [Kiritimatiellia bacterium]